MTADARLAALTQALAEGGLRALVMGGHAVRFYGIDRSTVDFDVCLALRDEEWANLSDRLVSLPLLGGQLFREGPSWRPRSFRRFVIGALADGREERLEIWRHNHLLAPFEELYGRRSEGPYGGGVGAFLGLDDLIRSKETEREDDWRDVALLEEIADSRRLLGEGEEGRVAALSRIRSRHGFERARDLGLLADETRLVRAIALAANPMAAAYLLPAAGRALVREGGQRVSALGDLGESLRAVSLGSARHLALVEAVRRLYRRDAMAADRADKEREAQDGA